MVFPSSDDAAEVVQPSKETFDLPASLGAPQRATILRAATAPPVRGNHLDAEVVQELLVQNVGVVPAVADQTRGEVFDEAGLKRGGDEVRLIRRSTGHVHGERKTMAVADRHDLAAFTASSRANGGPPFFAEAKVASTKASVRSSLPRSRRSAARRSSSRSSRPERCQS